MARSRASRKRQSVDSLSTEIHSSVVVEVKIWGISLGYRTFSKQAKSTFSMPSSTKGCSS
ncbi:unnamed protein product, partial [Mycena citricolor]